jgi:hypothetical protein
MMFNFAHPSQKDIVAETKKVLEEYDSAITVVELASGQDGLGYPRQARSEIADKSTRKDHKDPVK